MDAFAGLYTRQKESEQTQTANWLTPHMFYYHVLLHDLSQRHTTGYIVCACCAAGYCVCMLCCWVLCVHAVRFLFVVD